MVPAPLRGWTVRSALTFLKHLCTGRNRTAAGWREETRRLGRQPEDAEKCRAGMSRELFETKKPLGTVSEEEGKCQGHLQNWERWYAHHREHFLLAPVEQRIVVS